MSTRNELCSIFTKNNYDKGANVIHIFTVLLKECAMKMREQKKSMCVKFGINKYTHEKIFFKKMNKSCFVMFYFD